MHRAEQDAQDALALVQLAPLAGSMLPWTDFTMRAAAIVVLVDEVLILGRRNVLECGSGNSTVYLARLFEQLGEGRVVSLEHDAGWVAFVSGVLAREGLAHRADVVHAPLDRAHGWYAADLRPDGVDLLVVDGPPAYEPGMGTARHPALGWAWDGLAASASIVLDDVDRPGEQEVLSCWEAERGLAFELLPAGCAVART